MGKEDLGADLPGTVSQEKLGKALGITFQQVQKYESGKNRITIGRLTDICDVLDTTLKVVVEKD